MNDKVNVEIIVPEIEEKYNVLLPINKRIGTISNLLNKAVNELSYGDYIISNCNSIAIYQKCINGELTCLAK